MIIYGLLDILRQRADQPGFHVASEKSVRVQFMRLSVGQKLGPITAEGDMVVTILEGAFLLEGEAAPRPALTQIIVPERERLVIHCASTEGAIQIIWAPPFAPVTQG